MKLDHSQEMEGFTIFSNNQGCGYIHFDRDIIKSELKVIPISVCHKTLYPSDFTDLLGHFCRELEYLGMLGENEMIFRIGEIADLFRTSYLYQAVFRIDEERIFEMFSPGAGRDFLFKNGKWK
jgi:hypothetical protein